MRRAIVLKVDSTTGDILERHLRDQEVDCQSMIRKLQQQIQWLRRARCVLIKSKRKANQKKPTRGTSK